MKRLVFWLGLFLVLCGSAVVLLRHWFHREPSYQGRTLSEWLYGRANQDIALWWPGEEEADHAIRMMGTNAIPILLKELPLTRDKRSNVKANVSCWLYKLNLKKQARLFYDPYGQERWEAVVHAWVALRPCSKEVTPVLIDMFRTGQNQTLVLSALGLLRSKEAVPFLLSETSSTNARVRSGVFLALGEIHPDPELVVPMLIRGLQDTDATARMMAAAALGKYGPEASSAIPQLARFLAESTELLNASPLSAENRELANYAKAAFDRVTERRYSAVPITERDPDAEIERTRGSTPLTNMLSTSSAYRYVAVTRMLTEANYCAERLQLYPGLPIRNSDLRRAYVGPPQILGGLGSVDTDRYSFGFGESGRLRFITRLNLFGSKVLPEIYAELGNIQSNMSTNAAYELAKTWLSAVSTDLAALEKAHSAGVRQHFHYGSQMRKVFLPIFDVFWGDPSRPAVLVTIYAPTAELLQLRLNEESFSQRPPDVVQSAEDLLAISDAEFSNYSEVQRSNLVAKCLTLPGKK